MRVKLKQGREKCLKPKKKNYANKDNKNFLYLKSQQIGHVTEEKEDHVIVPRNPWSIQPTTC